MFDLIYEKGKQFMKKEWKLITLYTVTLFFCIIPLPFYIDKPGGAIDIRQKVDIKDSYESKGGFYYGYVSELRATIPLYLYAHLNKDWEIIKKEEMSYDHETLVDANKRSKILMDESNSNAIKIAYEKAHKNIKKQKEQIFIQYVDPSADTTLKVGDEIIEIEGKKIQSREDLHPIIQEYKVADKVRFLVQENEQKIEKYAIIQEVEGIPMIGLLLSSVKTYETMPKIDLKVDANESGPSGGLMLSLTIYDMLTKEDLTKGLKIVGTGTMEEDGAVGPIGGVEYKLKGAVKEKADIFLVPSGENYQEAMKLKKERGYDISIKAIKTFDEAVEYLQTLKV